ncbi:MAG: flagellar biosynthetic protein FliO [Oligoflexia bacterium]|nr:flagellar biosynthetic protein FliO [Oligoflexia bacterium]
MSKALWIVVLAMAGSSSLARAAVTTLKQVQVSGGSQIDLLFDAKVSKGQIKTEFFNDIVQVSLTDANVYPAKISSINGGNLVKIFAYQYAPKLVRCRITVRGKAETYKDRVRVSPSGKMLTIRFDQDNVGTDRIAVQASAPARVAPGAESETTVAVGGGEEAARLANAEERALLERVMNAQKAGEKDTAGAPVAVHNGAGAAKDAPAQKLTGRDSSRAPVGLTGRAKPLPGFGGVLAKLAAVIAAFGLIALLLKKFLGGRGEKLDENQMMGALGRFAKGGLGRTFGRKEKMIEVLSTHYLGPKKSIAVVRVGGRTLVLGVSNESINLITQLGGNPADVSDEDLGAGPELDTGAGAHAAGPAVFADLLKSESSKPAFSAPIAGRGMQVSQLAGAPAPTGATGVRARIRSRVEGLKPL